MFICSLKASTFKLFGIVVLSAVTLAILIGILPGYHGGNDVSDVAAIDSTVKFDNIKTNEDRINFIGQFGIEVKPDPVETVETKIPSKFDAVYKKYNDIQKAQGLDLSKYRNKDVTRYTYELTNPSSNANAEAGEDGTVYLNLIVCKDKVIGGDLTTKSGGGTVTGFIN